MDLQLISDEQRAEYNKLVSHVMQSWEWGNFRKQMELPVLRYGIFKQGKLSTAFQLTLHKIPFTNKVVGYLPKGPFLSRDLIEALKKIGEQENCAFIKIEPNIENSKFKIKNSKLKQSPKPLFTRYNFILDLTKSEEDLLKNMHPKTRYNIRLAQKHGVKVEERTDNEAFKIYLNLYFQTTSRQKYHGHNKAYHQAVWNTLKNADMARILLAAYKNTPLVAWMLFNFKDTLYYPYGGSSIEHKEVMANNLIAWEAIKLGKKMGLKNFDMWGALGPDANPKDPWFGFHRFKQGYGGRLVEYIGTYDLIFNYPLYYAFTLIDKLMPVKVMLLKLLGK